MSYGAMGKEKERKEKKKCIFLFLCAFNLLYDLANGTRTLHGVLFDACGRVGWGSFTRSQLLERGSGCKNFEQQNRKDEPRIALQCVHCERRC